MKVGPYTLIEELGRGGMAQVFLAQRVWEDGKRRSCAFKFPRRNAVTDEGMLRQFLEEQRLAILLRHNNIVRVFDAGVHEGLPYLVMDYIAGKDLAHIMRTLARVGVPFDVETAVHVVREIAEALLYAHEMVDHQGARLHIVHRDVASKNVMIDGTGGVLLMDFGVATSLITQTSRIHAKGTLANMAPEHYLNQASAASDVFGLGTIFWELLAGRPFRGGLTGPALNAAVLAGTVEPVGRALPPVVDQVLCGMLEPDASKRINLHKVLYAIKDIPPRRGELREMMGVHFARAGRRTGLSSIHYAASKELEDTLAVVKVAGISLADIQRRRTQGQPDKFPLDFAPKAKADTVRVDPRAIDDGLDDDADEESGRTPSVRQEAEPALAERAQAERTGGEPGRVVAGVEPAGLEQAQGEQVEQSGDERTDDPSGDIPNQWRTPAGTVRALRAPMPAAVALAVEEPEPERSTVRVDWSPPARRPAATEAPNQPATGEADVSGCAPPGDTLRSPGSGDPRPAPQTTIRLQTPIVAEGEVEGRTEFLPPPAEEHAGPPPSPLRAGERRRVDSSTSPAGSHRGGLLVLLAVLLLVAAGVTTWSSWAGAIHEEGGREADPTASSLVVENEAPAVLTRNAEPDRGAGLDSAEDLEEAPARIQTLPVSGPEGPAEPIDAPTPPVEPEPAATFPEADEPEPATEPPAAPSPEPEPEPEQVHPPQPAPTASEDSGVKKEPRPPKPKPKPKLDLVVRRGLIVDFGEVRVGRGKVTTVPPRGAALLHVAPGTYTLHYRTKLDGEWKSFRYTFSPNMKYAGRLEHTGLVIQAQHAGGQ